MKSLEVILKVAERCNINCTYCYFFNAGDNSYKEHSKIIGGNTILSLINFLNKGVAELNISYLSIDLHGGEPLLLGKKKFASLCDRLRKEIKVENLDLRVQTNAILIDKEWIDIFSTFDIKVSSSLDGSKEIHDEYRIDFKGKGTYDKTLVGIRKLKDAASQGLIDAPGVICVINPSINAESVFNHFVHELGFKVLEFLLPDYTHNTLPNGFSSNSYGEFLSQLYKTWFKYDDPTIQIRVLNSITSLLLGGSSFVAGYGIIMPNVITISSDGHLGPDDTIRVCGVDYIDYSSTIFTTSLKEYLNSDNHNNYKSLITELSSQCTNCCWFKLCGGGHPVHRYNDGKFNYPSIYCDGLKTFYSAATAEMIRKGFPFENLRTTLLETI